MKNKVITLLLVVLTSMASVYIFFSHVIPDINHKYFAQGGDGAKDYFNMLYHLKYDTSYVHSGAMNYPFGENIFFSGAQPFLTNTIRFISLNIFDIRPYTVGIHNFSILLSVLVTILILFSLFRHLRLPTGYSLIVALGITFLSPQIDRMGGHFSLSYLFAIPLLIYLIILFHEKQKLIFSLLIGLFFTILSFTHGYYFLFYAILLFSYWLYYFYAKRTINTIITLNVVIQFIIPITLFLLITNGVDNVTDRTSWPWGFLVYRAYPESVFLSMSRPYWQWLNKIVHVRNVEWEGIAYVGLISTIAFLYIIGKVLKNIFKKNYIQATEITDHTLLNLFFWVSLLTLLFSFGIPFIAGLEGLLQYLGPIRQFRGIGRFAWLFFYVLNIVVFYKLWHAFEKRKIARYWLIFPIAILLYDAWFNAKAIQYYISNRLPVFDYAYHNSYSGKLKIENYQAIMPIPYFNVGSENYWYDTECSNKLKSYALSLYTGLPLNAVNMSRTSISQCTANLQLVLFPYSEYEVLRKYNPDKKILLFVDTTCEKIPNDEKRIIQHSSYIDTLWQYQLREISIKQFDSIRNCVKQQLFNTKHTEPFYLNTFDEKHSPIAYMGTGALVLPLKKATKLYDSTLISNIDTTYSISFWVYGMNTDLVPRNVIEVAIGTSKGNWYKVEYYALKDLIKTFDKDWGLVELKMTTQHPNDYLMLTLLKPLQGTKQMIIDNLLIRCHDVMIPYNKGVIINNMSFP